MDNQTESNCDQIQNHESESDSVNFPIGKVKNEVQDETMDNNVFETSIALSVSLPEINDQSFSLLNQEVTEDQIAAIFGDYFSNNQETFSSVNTTTPLVKQEKGTNSNHFFDNSKPNEDKMYQQLESIINSGQSQGLNNYPNQNPSNVSQSPGIRMATYTPSITRPPFQSSSPQSLSFVDICMNRAQYESCPIMPSVPQSSYGVIAQPPRPQLFDNSLARIPPVFSKSNSDNYFARSFDPFENVFNPQNRQMNQNTNTNSNKFTGVKNSRIRRYFNDNHASHMRNTYNRINQQTSVDFDLMTKVFNDLKAPYELPFTKEQVIECYDWYVGAIQYNYVPGRRKQLPRETSQIALRDELRMIEAARKAADPSKEVICLD